RYLLEDDTRCVLVMEDDLGGHPDVLLPGQAFHLTDLAELASLVDPLAQIAVTELRRPFRFLLCRPVSFRSAHPYGLPILRRHPRVCVYRREHVSKGTNQANPPRLIAPSAGPPSRQPE